MKNYQFRRLLEKLPHLAILKKFEVFFEKMHLLFQNQNFERFEKFYYSSRLLRQFCYNLVKAKFHIRKRDRTSF